jgi:hypothetical protein
MSNRTISFLLVIALLSLGGLLVINTFNIHFGSSEARFLSPNNVRAVEVFRGNKPHPLSFEQQNQFIQVMNEAVKTGYEEDETVVKGPFSYQKIVIHQFEGPEITATPYGLITTQLLMTAPHWNEEGLIRETGPGVLNELFTQAVSE